MAQEYKFKVGDRINFIGCRANNGKIEAIDENGYYLKDGTFIHHKNIHLWQGIDEPFEL